MHYTFELHFFCFFNLYLFVCGISFCPKLISNKNDLLPYTTIKWESGNDIVHLNIGDSSKNYNIYDTAIISKPQNYFAIYLPDTDTNYYLNIIPFDFEKTDCEEIVLRTSTNFERILPIQTFNAFPSNGWTLSNQGSKQNLGLYSHPSYDDYDNNDVTKNLFIFWNDEILGADGVTDFELSAKRVQISDYKSMYITFFYSWIKGGSDSYIVEVVGSNTTLMLESLSQYPDPDIDFNSAELYPIGEYPSIPHIIRIPTDFLNEQNNTFFDLKFIVNDNGNQGWWGSLDDVLIFGTKDTIIKPSFCPTVYIDTTGEVKFEWFGNDLFSTGYKFYLGSDILATDLANGTDFGLNQRVTEFLEYGSFEPDTTYYYRVVTTNFLGNADCPVLNFSISAVCPTLLFTENLGYYEKLQWLYTYYEGVKINIGTSSGNYDLVSDLDLKKTNYHFILLESNTTYYFKFQPYESGNSIECPELQFKTKHFVVLLPFQDFDNWQTDSLTPSPDWTITDASDDKYWSVSQAGSEKFLLWDDDAASVQNGEPFHSFNLNSPVLDFTGASTVEFGFDYSWNELGDRFFTQLMTLNNTRTLIRDVTLNRDAIQKFPQDSLTFEIPISSIESNLPNKQGRITWSYDDQGNWAWHITLDKIWATSEGTQPNFCPNISNFQIENVASTFNLYWEPLPQSESAYISISIGTDDPPTNFLNDERISSNEPFYRVENLEKATTYFIQLRTASIFGISENCEIFRFSTEQEGFCGNGKCDVGERNCEIDCNKTCGNSICDPDESCLTCTDCGRCSFYSIEEPNLKKRQQTLETVSYTNLLSFPISPQTLGFDFPYFTKTYSEIGFGHGLFFFESLTPDDLENTESPECPFSTSDNNFDLISAFWGTYIPESGKVYAQKYEVCPISTNQKCYIITYVDWKIPSSEMVQTSAADFQIILYEFGDITIKFLTTGDTGGRGESTGLKQNQGIDLGEFTESLMWKCSENYLTSNNQLISFKYVAQNCGDIGDPCYCGDGICSEVINECVSCIQDCTAETDCLAPLLESSSDDGGLGAGAIFAIIFSILVILAIVLFIAWYLLIYQKKKIQDSENSTRLNLVEKSKSQFFKEDLELFSGEEFFLDLSKNSLDFGLGSNQAPVCSVVKDTIILTNTKGAGKPIDFLIRTQLEGENNKFVLTAEPEIGTVPFEESLEIEFKLEMLCTTKISQNIAVIEIPDKSYTNITSKIESELSTKLDFDELSKEGPPIGDGSFGTVYRGKWREQEIAMKVLKVQDMSPELEQEFFREIDIMSKLRHPNIVNFVGAVKIPGKYCLVTEFMKYGSLGHVLENEKLGFGYKLKVALDCAKGMSFLHNCGILHRDLKPDNLLVASLSRKAEICCKLTDFGTSRAVTEEAGKNYTKGLGTPIYMAPEILANGDYSKAADVYSFGILLYEVYTGEEPYTDFVHAWDIANFVTAGKRLEIPAEIPTFIGELIAICWDHQQDVRPSFGEITQQIEEILTKKDKSDRANYAAKKLKEQSERKRSRAQSEKRPKATSSGSRKSSRKGNTSDPHSSTKSSKEPKKNPKAMTSVV